MSDRIQKLLDNKVITTAEAKRRREQQRNARRTQTTVLPTRVRQTTPAVSGPITTRIPIVHSKGDIVTVTYSEVYKVLHRTGEATSSAVSVTPPFLSYLATSYSIYQRFRFRQASVSWEPLCSGLVSGSVAIAPCNHQLQPSDMSLVGVLNNPGGKGGLATIGFTVPLALKQYSDDWFPFKQDIAPPAGGLEFMWWHQAPKELAEPPSGLLRISYVIDFTAPVMPPTGIHEEAPELVRPVPPNVSGVDLNRSTGLDPAAVDTATPEQLQAMANALMLKGYELVISRGD